MEVFSFDGKEYVKETEMLKDQYNVFWSYGSIWKVYFAEKMRSNDVEFSSSFGII